MVNRTLRIFVVDDERIIAETLSAILTKSGFSTKSFVDPLAALSAIESDIPDLLISDVMMPQLSGIELAIKIKTSCPECKILLFSGQAGTAELLQVAHERGHDFHLLAKPVHPDDLLQQIRQDLSLVSMARQ